MTGAEHRTFIVSDVARAMQVTARRVRADIDVPEVAAFGLHVDTTFAGGSSGDAAVEARNVVAGLGGRVFSTGLDRGIEHAIATVMSALQDEIVDHLGRPWPEITDLTDGAIRGVLDVALEPTGIAHWRLRREPVCPIGELHQTCEALGWRVTG